MGLVYVMCTGTQLAMTGPLTAVELRLHRRPTGGLRGPLSNLYQTNITFHFFLPFLYFRFALRPLDGPGPPKGSVAPEGPDSVRIVIP